jgi:hypothetical protein
MHDPPIKLVALKGFLAVGFSVDNNHSAICLHILHIQILVTHYVYELFLKIIRWVDGIKHRCLLGFLRGTCFSSLSLKLIALMETLSLYDALEQNNLFDW